MKAGKLRHLVNVMQPVDSMTAKADDEITYTAGTPSQEWASIEPLQGRELQVANQIRGDLTHKITMRYRADVNFRTKLTWVDGANTTREFHLGPEVSIELRGVSASYYAVELNDKR
jgi:SPP1 family predicted phage head-tail adaptor